jgi:hypothetical protein
MELCKCHLVHTPNVPIDLVTAVQVQTRPRLQCNRSAILYYQTQTFIRG